MSVAGPSWLCNVRRRATEDWLTALKCQPVGIEGTIKGSPSPVLATQHQNFIATSPVAALIANIDCLRTDLFLLVWEGVVLFECFLRSDGEVFRHLYCQLTIGYCQLTIGYCQLTIGYCQLTILGHLLTIGHHWWL